MIKSDADLTKCYDELYSSWYMADWPGWKKKRIIKLLRQMNLPEQGFALDYGCGSGVFTRLLKNALPNWEIVGTDISEVGMHLASTISADVTYLKNNELPINKFDLIFSHHVLEHVDNIQQVAQDINRFANPQGKMLHILPCGNKGSLDYYIASHTVNGIDKERGNTFFYEEPLHLNRFLSCQLAAIFQQFKWKLDDSFFANHHLGCLSEMTGMNTQDIKKVTNFQNAVDGKSKNNIRIIRAFALLMYYLQRPYTYLKLKDKSKSWTGPLLRHPELEKPSFSTVELLTLPSYFFVKLRDLMERLDWAFFKKKENGSEMYLMFKKE